MGNSLDCIHFCALFSRDSCLNEELFTICPKCQYHSFKNFPTTECEQCHHVFPVKCIQRKYCHDCKGYRMKTYPKTICNCGHDITKSKNPKDVWCKDCNCHSYKTDDNNIVHCRKCNNAIGYDVKVPNNDVNNCIAIY